MVDNDVVMLQVNQQRLHSRTKPRGQDEKGAVAGTVAPTIGDEAWRDRFGSVRGGPVLRQRRDKETTKESGQEDRRFFFCLDAAWLNVAVVRAVALLSATNGENVATNVG